MRHTLRYAVASDGKTDVGTIVPQGDGGNTQLYMDRLFKALESFYHPSNNGRWNVSGTAPQLTTCWLKKTNPSVSENLYCYA